MTAVARMEALEVVVRAVAIFAAPTAQLRRLVVVASGGTYFVQRGLYP